MSTDLRVLVVDDSASYRGILARTLETIPGVRVCAQADGGRAAIRSMAEALPDLLLLDLQMGDLGGLDTLAVVRKVYPHIPVVMVSAAKDAANTLQALALGALDFISKPSARFSTPGALRADLVRITEVARATRRGRISLYGVRANHTAPPARGAPTRTLRTPPPEPPPPRHPAVRAVARSPRSSFSASPALVILGASTGGPTSLPAVLSALSPPPRVPIVVLQHMPAGFTASLASQLDQRCPLPVQEARSGIPLEAGHVYVAQGGQHAVLARTSRSGYCIQTARRPVPAGCHPSIDIFMHSVADICAGPVLSVILTGMGCDGTAGVQELRALGGWCIAQDEATSVVYGMPRAVREAGAADEVLPLPSIGYRLRQLLGPRRPPLLA